VSEKAKVKSDSEEIVEPQKEKLAAGSWQ